MTRDEQAAADLSAAEAEYLAAHGRYRRLTTLRPGTRVGRLFTTSAYRHAVIEHGEQLAAAAHRLTAAVDRLDRARSATRDEHTTRPDVTPGPDVIAGPELSAERDSR